MTPEEFIEYLNDDVAGQLDLPLAQKLVDDICASVAEAYIGFGDAYSRLHEELSPRSKQVLSALLAQLNEIFPHEELSVLDAGCGTGCELAYLSGLKNVQAYGLERSTYFLDYCRRAGLASRLIHADLRHLPLQEESINMFFAKASLLHIPYVKGVDVGIGEVFHEAARVVKQGGLFYFYGRKGKVGYIQESTGRFFQLFEPEDLQELCHNHGFKVLRLEKQENKSFSSENWRWWLEMVAQKA